MLLPRDVYPVVDECALTAFAVAMKRVDGDLDEVVDHGVQPHGVVGDGIKRRDRVVAREHAAGRVDARALALGEQAVAPCDLLLAHLSVELAVDEMRAVVVADARELACDLAQLRVDFGRAPDVLARQ